MCGKLNFLHHPRLTSGERDEMQLIEISTVGKIIN